jgi:hypothetical protein
MITTTRTPAFDIDFKNIYIDDKYS